VTKVTKVKEYAYAKDLATYLWQTHYKADASEWEPCEDLMGVLTQIDNMIVGLTKGTNIQDIVVGELPEDTRCCGQDI
jgi:hypothetical protein